MLHDKSNSLAFKGKLLNDERSFSFFFFSFFFLNKMLHVKNMFFKLSSNEGFLGQKKNTIF